MLGSLLVTRPLAFVKAASVLSPWVLDEAVVHALLMLAVPAAWAAL